MPFHFYLYISSLPENCYKFSPKGVGRNTFWFLYLWCVQRWNIGWYSKNIHEIYLKLCLSEILRAKEMGSWHFGTRFKKKIQINPKEQCSVDSSLDIITWTPQAYLLSWLDYAILGFPGRVAITSSSQSCLGKREMSTSSPKNSLRIGLFQ